MLHISRISLMEQKELDRDFATLRRDYESSQVPQWYDPMTIDTLDKIVNSIHLGRYTLDDFESFAKEHLGRDEFTWRCLRYVRNRV